MEFIRYSDGVLVEVTDAGDDDTAYGMAADARTVMTKFRDVAGSVRERIDEIGDQLKRASSAPDEVTVEFGIELESSSGVPIIVQGKAKTHLKVTATWKKAQ